MATIATSLDVGTSTRVVPAGELEDAACAIVGARRDAGLDRVLMPTSVWDLVALADGEALMFSREAVAQLSDCLTRERLDGFDVVNPDHPWLHRLGEYRSRRLQLPDAHGLHQEGSC